MLAAGISFLAVFALRIFISFLFEGWVLGSVAPTLRYFWAIVIWDHLHLYFFAHAFFTDRVTYHGKTYRFAERYRLEEVASEEVAAGGRTGLFVRA